MRALITGGAGFIGSHLSETLLDRGWEVTILDDLSTGSMSNIEHLVDNPGFSFAIDTILNDMVLDRLASECDIIYHLAAAVGVELIVKRPVHTIRTNVEGTDCVLRAATRYRKPVVIASTSEVYGKSTQIPFREEDDTVSGPTSKHRWAYACSKALDEFAAFAAAKESDLPVYVVRLFNTVGTRQTGQYGMVVPRFVTQALANKPITVYGDGTQSRCFTNVIDVVGALTKLPDCQDALGEVINLGNIQEISIAELAELVKSELNSESEITYIPYSDAYEAGFEDMQRRVPCLDKAKRLIGYEPTISLVETIHMVADYFQENG
jgi:UDP-glucose 4-epimerase